MAERTIVLKFGSSVIPGVEKLGEAAHEVYRWRRRGYRVVAVVSALEGSTDTLLRQASGFGVKDEERSAAATATLVSTGEAQSVGLLALSLAQRGVPALPLDAGSVGLRTRGPLLDAAPVAIDTGALSGALDAHGVVVLPGFVGRDASGVTSLLGRGGSDLSALFIADALGAECRLLKDVAYLYDRDPAREPREARAFARVSWDDVLRLSEGIIQHKGVRFARERRQEFVVARCGRDDGTTVGRGPTRRLERVGRQEPLRVALLGLGTVGAGVLSDLNALAGEFVVIGVGVRDIGRHAARGVPAGLLTTDLIGLVEGRTHGQPDVIVEALPGLEPARSLVDLALGLGRHVVSANKAVAGHGGPLLEVLAARRGVRYLHSAAVGGSGPFLERVVDEAAGRGVASLSGVLNATSNFLLDRMHEGVAIGEALAEARACGYAEADASADVDGHDAARKLVILARGAFGAALSPSDVHTRGIGGLTPRDAAAAAGRGRRLRLVSTARRTARGVSCEVVPVELEEDHPLARVRGVENLLCIERADGTVLRVPGVGAGRWPTTQSVLADLWDVRRGVPEPGVADVAVDPCALGEEVLT